MKIRDIYSNGLNEDKVSEEIKEIMSFLSMESAKILYPKRQPRKRVLWTECGVAFKPY